MGLDLGRRRTGVAVSDSGGRVATPHTVITGSDDEGAHRAAVAAVVRELGADVVVVGLPLSLDGSMGPAARWAQDEARELSRVLDVPVHLHDERLTTVAASRGVTRARRDDTDARAATIMLQSWLDCPKEEVG